MKATIKLISSIWTLEFEMVSADEIKILRYSRDDPEGYEKEDQFPRLMIDEDAERTVLGVSLCRLIHSNAGLIFPTLCIIKSLILRIYSATVLNFRPILRPHEGWVEVIFFIF